MRVTLYDIREYGKPITRTMVEEELENPKFKKQLETTGLYVDSMRNLDSVDKDKAVCVIKDLWFVNDYVIKAEVEFLDTPIGFKLSRELPFVKFLLKGKVINGELTLIGFGYCYKPKFPKA